MNRSLLLSLALAVMLPVTVAATEYEVDMRDLSADTADKMVFVPDLLAIDVGDTVTWRSVDRGHNVEFIRKGIPKGVKPFRSGLNRDVSYTFEKEGLYVYKCTPHFGMGMVGIIAVGEPINLDAIKALRLPKKAYERKQAAIDSFLETQLASTGAAAGEKLQSGGEDIDASSEKDS